MQIESPPTHLKHLRNSSFDLLNNVGSLKIPKQNKSLKMVAGTPNSVIEIEIPHEDESETDDDDDDDNHFRRSGSVDTLATNKVLFVKHDYSGTSGVGSSSSSDTDAIFEVKHGIFKNCTSDNEKNGPDASKTGDAEEKKIHDADKVGGVKRKERVNLSLDEELTNIKLNGGISTSNDENLDTPVYNAVEDDDAMVDRVSATQHRESITSIASSTGATVASLDVGDNHDKSRMSTSVSDCDSMTSNTTGSIIYVGGTGIDSRKHKRSASNASDLSVSNVPKIPFAINEEELKVNGNGNGNVNQGMDSSGDAIADAAPVAKNHAMQY